MMMLTVANWRVRLLCRPPALADCVARRYAAFLTSSAGEPDFTVTADVAPPSAAVAAPPEPEDDIDITRHGPLWSLAARTVHGRIDADRREAAFVFSEMQAAVLGIEHLLRIAFAVFAEHLGGLLLHASGVLNDGQAHLFMGPGGSGKSTVVRLSPGKPILNDDMVILRPDAGAWTAFGTPFWNIETRRRTGQTEAGPIAGIYALVQDPDTYLEPLSAAAATAELVTCCPIVNGATEVLPQLMARCRSLAQGVAVQRLHFRQDPSFWRLLG